MLAKAIFTQIEKAPSLTVPESAVCKRENKEGIFIVKSGRATFVPITSGLRKRGLIEVISGLTDPEVDVVIAGAASSR